MAIKGRAKRRPYQSAMQYRRRRTYARRRAIVGSTNTAFALPTTTLRWTQAGGVTGSGTITFTAVSSTNNDIAGFQIIAAPGAHYSQLVVNVRDAQNNTLNGWQWTPTVSAPYFNKSSYPRNLNGVSIIVSGNPTAVTQANIACNIKTMST